jgi:hypothetical protein
MPAINLDRMTWDRFFEAVKSERDERGNSTLDRRVYVLDQAKMRFQQHQHFKEMPPLTRYEVAGIVLDRNSDHGWFGSMFGAGRFKAGVKRNDPHLSKALDHIPLSSSVMRKHYFAYVKEIKKAFPKGGGGLATATRLLTMKRPDVFVCLDKENKSRLCEAFDVPQSLSFEAYWDLIVKRIQACKWWNVRRPASRTEALVWDGRAAFLDALFYEWD